MRKKRIAHLLWALTILAVYFAYPAYTSQGGVHSGYTGHDGGSGHVAPTSHVQVKIQTNHNDTGHAQPSNNNSTFRRESKDKASDKHNNSNEQDVSIQDSSTSLTGFLGMLAI